MEPAKHKVLFVDDEPSILTSIERCLRREPFDVITVGDPEDALRVLDEESIAVLVADQRMPGMTGTDLLARARETYPHTIRIMLTGQSDLDAAIGAINEGEVYRYLVKPWDNVEFRATIRQAVSRFDLMASNRRLYELTRTQCEELDDLNTQLKDALSDAVQILTCLLEMRSSTVGAHSTRVAALAQRTALGLGMIEADAWAVGIGGALHDIGKAVMSDRVLSQAVAPNTKAAQLIARQHPIIGAELVKRVRLFDRVAETVRHHHELCDGSGYPDHLVSFRIPVGARIVGLVNAYDNLLNSVKNFRTTTPRQVIEQLRERVPHHFDRQIFSCLEELVLTGKDPERPDDDEIGLRGSDLQAGMVLSRDLRTSLGALLLPRQTRLRGDHIARLQALGSTDAILGGIFVFRSPPEEK